MVGKFKQAEMELEARHGRPASLMELEEYFKSNFTLSPQQRKKFNRRNISRLRREVRRDVMTTPEGSEYGVEEHDPTDALALHTVYSDQTPRDQVIFEHATGYGGSSLLKNVEIARKLGVSPTTIGKRKKRFTAMLERALL